ncbi:MAG: hypothetical protein E6R08_10110 [Nevskiaceae bacterium]|nr:MAG: hypothetical protein E6R08_10110 [Nevskiaceae bacterium]
MEICHLTSPSEPPAFALPLSLMSQFFMAYARHKPGSTLQDMPPALVAVEHARLVEPTFAIPIKETLLIPLNRGDTALVRVMRPRMTDALFLAVGLSLDDRWVYHWDAGTNAALTAIAAKMEPKEEFRRLPTSVQKWLATGNRGRSSEAMCRAIFGVPVDGDGSGWRHPLDADDFRRCLGFLKAVPEARKQLVLIADKSPTWASLVEHWGELEALYDHAHQVKAAGLARLSNRIEELAKAG